MAFEVVTSSDPRVTKVVKAVGSRKKKAYLCGYTPGATYLTGWDDGSRDEYSVVTKRGECVPLVGKLDENRNGDPYRQRFVFPEWNDEWDAVVRGGTSMGKPATPTVMRPGQ